MLNLEGKTKAKEAAVSSIIRLVTQIRDFKLSVDGAINQEAPENLKEYFLALDRKLRRFDRGISRIETGEHKRAVSDFYDTALFVCIQYAFRQAQAAEVLETIEYR